MHGCEDCQVLRSACLGGCVVISVVIRGVLSRRQLAQYVGGRAASKQYVRAGGNIGGQRAVWAVSGQYGRSTGNMGGQRAIWAVSGQYGRSTVKDTLTNRQPHIDTYARLVDRRGPRSVKQLPPTIRTIFWANNQCPRGLPGYKCVYICMGVLLPTLQSACQNTNARRT